MVCPPHRIRSIHYLRAVAALMVVVYHGFSYRLLTAADPASVLWLREGVALFFAISGYVMVVSTSDRTDAASFLLRRLWRVGPLFWIATACVALGSGERDWSRIVSSMLFLPHFSAETGTAVDPILPVGWTLNFEMAFYVLFALLLPLRRPVGLALAVVLLTALSCLGAASEAPPVLRYYGQPILLNFVSGIIIAHFDIRLPRWLLPVGFMAMALTPQLGDGGAIAVTASAALILASARSFDDRLKAWRVAEGLGDASYAIYLSHLFVLTPVLRLFGPDRPAAFILGVAGAVIAGMLVHLYVERPLTLLTRRRRSPRLHLYRPSAG